jgi:hypothetical protein
LHRQIDVFYRGHFPTTCKETMMNHDDHSINILNLQIYFILPLAKRSC